MASDSLSSSQSSAGGVATADSSASPASTSGRSSKAADRSSVRSTADTSGSRLSTAPGGATVDNSPKWLGKRIGRFRLIGVIGKGAMGKVFRAEDIQLHRLVALKVISSRSSRKRTAAQKHEQFMREGRSSAKLDHPNIVSVYEVSSAADLHYIAMELIEGGNLKDLVTAAGPLDVQRACQLAADAADGLQHAHEQGVIHRDIKPANLMLTRSGRCKLGDFGLARLDDLTDDGTGLSAAVGTPLFVAPEVALGHEATALSDIYSLGATIYFLLTGKPPFPGEQSQEVLKRHVEELPPDIRSIRPEIPESLALAIWRALAKEPTARFESAGHFARALRLHVIQVDAPSIDESVKPDQGLLPALTLRTLSLIGLLGGGLMLALVVAVVVLAMRGNRRTGEDLVAQQPPTQLPQQTPQPIIVQQSAATDDPFARPYMSLPLPAVGQVIPSTDSATLMRVAGEPDPAKHNGKVSVEGWVLRVAGAKDKDQTIYFRGVDQKRGVICRVPADVYATVAAAISAGLPEGLPTHRVRVSGQVELIDGQPVVNVTSANQIVVQD
ncbi:serine/threonine-protein kinase [Humisphaera borealis]|uniref:Serine/threonine protein kinase n=1 Tax=Humisphaera borealis TaxID=2807512 RepID=A0A7M2WZ83_9BACT|nr:serine/threonine-protein kinase [Humisphaera borealis]QOV89800.1 serine/threonine protein kinase [Humisphaera borealis]